MKKPILVLVVVLIACKSSTAPGPQQFTIEDYFPYSEYENFVYEYAYENGDTNSYTDEVTSTTEFQGQTVYVIDEYYYNVIIDGEWREYGEMPTEEGEYSLNLKEPLELGTNVESLSHSYISGVNLTLNTYLGELENCIEVTFPNNGQRQYFAPGYGKVKDIVEDWTMHLKEVQ